MAMLKGTVEREVGIRSRGIPISLEGEMRILTRERLDRRKIREENVIQNGCSGWRAFAPSQKIEGQQKKTMNMDSKRDAKSTNRYARHYKVDVHLRGLTPNASIYHDILEHQHHPPPPWLACAEESSSHAQGRIYILYA